MNTIKGYVTRIDSEIVLVLIDPASQSALEEIGFLSSGEKNIFVYTPQDDSEKYQVLSKLRDDDFAFSSGRDWSPSELVEYYKEQGDLIGVFKKIAWSTPDSYFIEKI